MKPGAALLALAALLAHTTAAAAQDQVPCLTEAEVSDLAVFLLPPLIDQAAIKCGPVLPPSAYLNRSGANLSARLRPAASAAWPNARRIAERIGQDQLSGFLSEDVERSVIEAAVPATIVANLKPEACGTVSDFVETVSPLPPRNIGRLVALVIRAGGRSIELPFRLCALNGRP